MQPLLPHERKTRAAERVMRLQQQALSRYVDALRHLRRTKTLFKRVRRHITCHIDSNKRLNGSTYTPQAQNAASYFCSSTFLDPFTGFQSVYCNVLPTRLNKYVHFSQQ